MSEKIFLVDVKNVGKILGQNVKMSDNWPNSVQCQKI